jgi:hypothetical protein
MIERIQKEQSNVRLFAVYLRDLDLKGITWEQLDYIIELQKSANKFLEKLDDLEKVLKNVSET